MILQPSFSMIISATLYISPAPMVMSKSPGSELFITKLAISSKLSKKYTSLLGLVRFYFSNKLLRTYSINILFLAAYISANMILSASSKASANSSNRASVLYRCGVGIDTISYYEEYCLQHLM